MAVLDPPIAVGADVTQGGRYLEVAQRVAFADPKSLLVAELTGRRHGVDDGRNGLVRDF